MPAFIDRLTPAPRNGGFRMDDYWVWCGSVIRGDDGRWHMFASRWPKALTFIPHWLTNSEVVRASSEHPAGPYTFEEVVLPMREGAWDGRMTHNPTIHRCGDTWLLYYTGTTYSGPVPTPEAQLEWGGPVQLEARANQRIGLAVASSVTGPWRRFDQPVLDARPGRWDAIMTTNPAPCVHPDRRCLLVYKSARDQQDLLRMGVAAADHWQGPYRRLAEEPIFCFDDTGDHVEDAYIWHNGSGYELIMKDMAGGICGEKGGGIHATSADGITWQLSDPVKAYSKTVHWQDGGETTFLHFERPQLLIEDGHPTHLFAAVAQGDTLKHAEATWNVAIPLEG